MQLGFKAVTMDQVARQAGISKKTLYQHYSNKNDLVKTFLMTHHRNTHLEIDRQQDESKNAVEGMVRTMRILNDEFGKMNPLAFVDLQKFFLPIFRIFKEKMMEENVASIYKNLSRGVAEGVYRPELNLDFMARYRLDSCLLLFNSGSVLTKMLHPQDLNKELGEHFLYGIMTPKGEKLFQAYKAKYLTTK